MIGSFWNLCRACPSMPVDKLHSEYRSTYRWHEFTGNSRPEVVRRAPAPNQSQFDGPTNEPSMPRRKKCPELAYKSHEFIIGSEYTDARRDASAHRLARSEERGGTPSRRSKSEGPPVVPNGRAYPAATEIDGATRKQAATLHELEPLVSDTDDRKTHEKQVTIVERKSRPFSQAIDHERVNHFITKKENFGFTDAAFKDEVDNKHGHSADSGHVVVMNGTDPPHSKPNLDLWFKDMVELRKKAGEYKSRGWGREIDPDLYKKQKDLWDQVSRRSSLSALSLASTVHRPITKEEKEQENNKKSAPLPKTPLKPRVPGQAYLVDNKDEISALPARFSNIRHHLERTTGPDVEEGALLPSPTREKLMPAITKRESESQRGSPKKTALSRHGSPQKGSPQKGSPKKVLKSRSQSVGPGVAENESPKRQIRSASQAPTASRKKTPTSATTAAGSERKTRPSTLSTTFQSRIKSSSLPPPNGRVASAPTATATATANRAASATKSTLNANQPHANQSQTSKPKTAHGPSRTNKILKSSATSATAGHQQQQKQQQQQQMRKTDKDRSNISCIGFGSTVGAGSGSQTNSVKNQQNKQKQQQLQQQEKQQKIDATSDKTQAATSTTVAAATAATAGTSQPVVQSTAQSASPQSATSSSQNPIRPATINIKRLTVPGQDRKLAENDGEDGRETAISISSCSPQPPLVPEVPEEPLVKSPPEPTRVKSPEQIIMRSPDPVNWTVPLDTGKTFTVTQNVKDGENYSRPQSEIKASTPVEKPPPPPQSAPPQLTEQAKMDAWKSSSPTTSGGAVYGKTLTPHVAPGGAVRQQQPVDQPQDQVMSSSSSTGTASTARTTAAEVLEKARDRFDRFWGSSASKEESV
ncbi:serine/arginine repetitive matrix protein 1 isoform X3 [Drosophila obscura]|uniref:serine/arginine repetitive matrix protein 1 isoform X3 n=1 Tax=Drosophila obscura TaxID=7282 RepID=UPI001BB0DB3A|nr:serine/arginine repetitive matrix protein 1 isoform X3 [Drosophila obscura]